MMEIMTIVVCLLTGVFVLFAYTLGLKNGQKLSKQEKIELPIIQNTEREIEKEEYDAEQEKIMKVLANIEAYDGTSKGQEVIK